MVNDNKSKEGENGVLIIYTGGTVGSVHRKRANNEDPLVPGSPDEILEKLGISESGHLSFKQIDLPVTLVSIEKLIDSTNIVPENWIEIASIIEKNYESFSGFVVLHGTDTMAYTASALSFMFRNLGKPVVITGAQNPIGEARSDALQNIITAIEIAGASLLGNTVIPEVSLFFGDRLIRGSRATKISATSYRGFDSPNCDPLAIAGSRIIVNSALVRAAGSGPLSVQYGMVTQIAVLQLTPLMSCDVLKQILSAKDLKGLIIAAYGVGNVPDNCEFLDAIKGAQEKGIKIAVVTQCRQGSVYFGRYQVSAGLLETGVISGLDMTVEAAQMKMGILLHNEHPDSIENLMSINMRGELSESVYNLEYSSGEASSGNSVELVPVPAVMDIGGIVGSCTKSTKAITNCQLRFVGASIQGPDGELLQVTITISNSRNDVGKQILPFTWSHEEKETIIIANVTNAVKKLSYWNGALEVKVETSGNGVLSWTRLDLSVFESA
jgi:L-asparaginase